MSPISTTTARPTSAPLTRRAAARWMVTFAAFPVGSLAAGALVGPVDGTAAALAGGLVNGLVLGVAQAWALLDRRFAPMAWVAATAAGFAAGLGVGATAVGFATDARSLAVMGALSGAGVGLAQGVVLLPQSRSLAAAWPLLLAAAWAVGWTVTAAVGVEVDRQFTVFGSSGAVVVAALTLVLPAVLRRAGRGVRS